MCALIVLEHFIGVGDSFGRQTVLPTIARCDCIPRCKGKWRQEVLIDTMITSGLGVEIFGHPEDIYITVPVMVKKENIPKILIWSGNWAFILSTDIVSIGS